MIECSKDFFLGSIPFFLNGIFIFLHAFFITLISTKTVIKNMKKVCKGGQPITSFLPQHQEKSGTPSMGGIAILMGIIIPTLLWRTLSHTILTGYAILITFASIGAFDDISKFIHKTNKGISPKVKFILQCIASALAVIGIIISTSPHISAYSIHIPFLIEPFLESPLVYIPLAILTTTSTANAVNLTDGLDGLAVRTLIPCFILVAIIAFVASEIELSHMYSIEYIPAAKDIVILALSACGALTGFLWHNKPKATIFMGDTGAMSLGALLAFCFLVIRHELLLPIAGFVILFETLSVIIQMFFIKCYKRKVFLFTPFHHHLEYKGWSETTITFRLGIASTLSCTVALFVFLMHAYINAVPSS